MKTSRKRLRTGKNSEGLKEGMKNLSTKIKLVKIPRESKCEIKKKKGGGQDHLYLAIYIKGNLR